jgi:hypothetical protein
MYNIKDDCFKNSHPVTLDIKCTSRMHRLYSTLGHITIIQINKERIANIIPEAALSYILVQTDACVMLSKVRYINIYMVPHICLLNDGSV